MTDVNTVVLAVLWWLAAASITRAITRDAIFAPVREVHHQRIEERAAALLANLRSMPQDHPKRWRRARKYEWLIAWAGFYGCPWCISFWVYAITAPVTWLAADAPSVFWGGRAWFTVTAAALAGRWLYSVLAKWVDPPQSGGVTVLPS